MLQIRYTRKRCLNQADDRLNSLPLTVCVTQCKAILNGSVVLKANTDGKGDCWKIFRFFETANGHTVSKFLAGRPTSAGGV